MTDTRDYTTGEADAYRRGWHDCWQRMQTWVTCHSSPGTGHRYPGDGGTVIREPESAWRPIETAPKEDTVLVCCGDYVWVGKVADKAPGIITGTHWMPLPTPPHRCGPENASARPAGWAVGPYGIDATRPQGNAAQAPEKGQSGRVCKTCFGDGVHTSRWLGRKYACAICNGTGRLP